MRSIKIVLQSPKATKVSHLFLEPCIAYFTSGLLVCHVTDVTILITMSEQIIILSLDFS